MQTTQVLRHNIYVHCFNRIIVLFTVSLIKVQFECMFHQTRVYRNFNLRIAVTHHASWTFAGSGEIQSDTSDWCNSFSLELRRGECYGLWSRITQQEWITWPFSRHTCTPAGRVRRFAFAFSFAFPYVNGCIEARITRISAWIVLFGSTMPTLN